LCATVGDPTCRPYVKCSLLEAERISSASALIGAADVDGTSPIDRASVSADIGLGGPSEPSSRPRHRMCRRRALVVSHGPTFQIQLRSEPLSFPFFPPFAPKIARSALPKDAHPTAPRGVSSGVSLASPPLSTTYRFIYDLLVSRDLSGRKVEPGDACLETVVSSRCCNLAHQECPPPPQTGP
jgi:hypothetical protein